MDLRFTPEENAFRDEVRAFFKENLPDGIRRKAYDSQSSSENRSHAAWRDVPSASPIFLPSS